MLAAGYFPMKILERRYRKFSLADAIFCSLILGYFLFESLFAIWLTGGYTSQWINLLCIFSPVFLSISPQPNQYDSEKAQPAFTIAFFLFLIIAISLYFLKSYSDDFIRIGKAPFIDLASYACTSYGIRNSGFESPVFGSLLFFPEKRAFGFYHFSELWFNAGICSLSKVSDMFAFLFFTSPFLILLTSAGLFSLGSKLIKSKILLAALVLAVIGSNGKLILGNDHFLFNALDLCGIKISLLVPLLAFLHLIRKNHGLLLSFSCLAIQSNILYLPWTGFLWFFLLKSYKSKRTFSLWLMGIPILNMVLLAALLIAAGSAAGSSTDLTFVFPTPLQVVIQTFTYFREAVFNLGFNYWLPFIIISGIFINRSNLILLAPFLSGKILWRLVQMAINPPEIYNSIGETGFFLLAFAISFRYLSQSKKNLIPLLLGGIFLLCLFGGAGHVITGHMDFEQLYTLATVAVYTLLSIGLFTGNSESSGLVSIEKVAKFRHEIMAVLLLMLLFKTYRLQRSIPFDEEFYRKAGDMMEPINDNLRSACYLNKPLFPFPLHVQAGIPLLTRFPDAISTPMNIFSDSSWQRSSRAAQVHQLPLYIFSTMDEKFKEDGNQINLELRFLQKFKIRFIWVERNVKSETLSIIRRCRIKSIGTKGENMELWEINPDGIMY